MDQRDVGEEGKNRKRKVWGIEIKTNCKRFPTISERLLLLQNLLLLRSSMNSCLFGISISRQRQRKSYQI
jgi:hypothetical protein